jgi:uncharacterized membrane protein (DUF485 family)
MNTSRLELWIWFFSAAAFFLFPNMFRHASFRRQFLKYGGLVTIPVTLAALVENVRHSSNGLYTLWKSSASFTNPAVLAGFALSWTILFWHFRKKDRLYRWLFGACLVTLILAASWWSLVSLMIGFAYYYRQQIKTAISVKRSSAVGGGIILAGFLLTTVYVKFGLSRESFNSLSDRWGWWIAGFRMVREHPLVGVGLGSYGTAFPFFKTQGMLNTLYAHSFPLQLLSETGLLGAGGVLWLVIRYVRGLRAQKTIDADSNAYQAALVSLLCFSAATIYMEYFIGKLMLLIVIALTLSAVDLKSIVLSKKALGLAEIGFLLLIPGWYLPFCASQYHARGLQYEERGENAQAEFFFQKGLSLNPEQDESYAQLANLSKRAYLRSGSQAELSQWRFNLDHALRWKRDVHYFADLSQPQILETGKR